MIYKYEVMIIKLFDFITFLYQRSTYDINQLGELELQLDGNSICDIDNRSH